MRSIGTILAASMALLCVGFVALSALSVLVALNIEEGSARYWILSVQNAGMAGGTGLWATVAAILVRP